MFTMRIGESAPFFLSVINYSFFSLPPFLSPLVSPFSPQDRQTFIHASNGDHDSPSSSSPFITITLYHHRPSSPSFPLITNPKIRRKRNHLLDLAREEDRCISRVQTSIIRRGVSWTRMISSRNDLPIVCRSSSAPTLGEILTLIA